MKTTHSIMVYKRLNNKFTGHSKGLCQCMNQPINSLPCGSPPPRALLPLVHPHPPVHPFYLLCFYFLITSFLVSLLASMSLDLLAHQRRINCIFRREAGLLRYVGHLLNMYQLLDSKIVEDVCVPKRNFQVPAGYSSSWSQNIRLELARGIPSLE